MESRFSSYYLHHILYISDVLGELLIGIQFQNIVGEYLLHNISL